MRAIFSGSNASTAPPDPPPPPPNSHPNTSPLNQHYISSPPPPPPALSVSTPDDSSLRHIRSKSSLRSLRSLGSSHNDEELLASPTSPDHLTPSDKSIIRPSILRRLSPGLAARVKLLDGSHKSTNISRNSPGAVGRIPEEQIKELDTQHQNLSNSIKVQKKGRTWNALHLSSKEKKHLRDTGQSHLLEVPSLGPDEDMLEDDSLPLESHSDPGSSADTPVEQEFDIPPIEEAREEEKVEEEREQEKEQEQEQQPEQRPEQRPEQEPEPEPEQGQQQEQEQQQEQQPEQEQQTEIQVAEEPAPTVADMSLVQPPPAPLVPAPVADPDPQEQTDFEKYIQTTRESESEDAPPPPPPKDSPPRPSSSASSITSYFNPGGLQRTESIFSFSRASFSNQLSQLTAIPLPQASSLESSISGISNAPAAVRALTGSAEQIQIWIKKASGVLGGLDAEDEVEWAAAGGREGLDDVEKAILRFETLINVYVKAIEDVQLRADIEDVSTDSLKVIVVQMDFILQNWTEIKASLKRVKEQVELAMEWEELWNNILGDVGNEVESLSMLIFEMEEKRHSTMEDSQFPGVDINELETIVEETPSNGNNRASKRLSMELFAAPPTLDTPIIQTPQDESIHSDLIALFARIQPLRASLAFLPMRLSMFQARAERVFPSACADLEQGITRLEEKCKKLEKEAESLRQEISEDRWILVFRNAGSQAHKMFQSVERSIAKLQEALEAGAHVHNPTELTKRIESYEAKKQHYVPAIERVITIIQKGIKDRLTVNGETLTLLSDMTTKMDALRASTKVMDASLEDVNYVRSQQLRDSISSIVTMDSPATGSVVDTPGSSPASSVVMTPFKGASTPMGGSSRRGSSVSSAARTTMSKVRRYSGLPQAANPLNLTAKKSAIPKPSLGVPSPSKASVAATPTPASRKIPRPTPSPVPNRPRWNGSVNTNDLDHGYTYYKPNTMSNLPTPFRKSSAPTGRTSRPSSTLPFSGMSRRDLSASPAPSTARSTSRVSSRLATRSPAPARMISPSPGSSILDPPPYSKLRRPAGAEKMVNTPRNRQSYAGPSFSRSVSQDQSRSLMSPTKADRPGTALGHSNSRRISLLPLPKTKSGRDSPAAGRGKIIDRPRWR